ncbi:MAG: GtrA-like protein [Bradyrhizobium sp.]|nr:GtrA-like protein [Bradyrhizobium sp.]
MKSVLDQIGAVWQNRTVVVKLLSFASIGVLNTAIDLLVFTAAYKILALPLIASNVLAWLVAVSASYAMNTKLTFGRETGGVFRTEDFLRFVGSGFLGVIVTTTTLVIFSHYTTIVGAKLLSVMGGFAVNFSLTHFVVFRPVRTRVGRKFTLEI